MARYKVNWGNEDGTLHTCLYTTANSEINAISNTRARLWGFGYNPNSLIPTCIYLGETKPKEKNRKQKRLFK